MSHDLSYHRYDCHYGVQIPTYSYTKPQGICYLLTRENVVYKKKVKNVFSSTPVQTRVLASLTHGE